MNENIRNANMKFSNKGSKVVLTTDRSKNSYRGRIVFVKSEEKQGYTKEHW